MKIAVWIIAICEVARMLQNLMQLKMLRQDTGARDNAYNEFIKSLKQSDEEFAEKLGKDLLEYAEKNSHED